MHLPLLLQIFKNITGNWNSFISSSGKLKCPFIPLLGSDLILPFTKNQRELSTFYVCKEEYFFQDKIHPTIK